MSTDQNLPQKAEAPNRPRDMLSRLYREIGIPAVAAVLEATAGEPLNQPQSREDIPSLHMADRAA